MIYERDRGICGICHEPVTDGKAAIDHIIPISGGGAHEPDNWQLAHIRCNSRKGGIQPPRTKREAVTIRLRLSDELHDYLARSARENTRSLNGEIVATLRKAQARREVERWRALGRLRPGRKPAIR